MPKNTKKHEGMRTVGQRERLTQHQVLRFLGSEPGYSPLGDRKDHSAITETLYETSSKREADA